MLKLVQAMNGSALAGLKEKHVEFVDGMLRPCADPESGISLVDILAANGRLHLEATYLLLPAVLKQRKFTRATHSAVFCEVRVDEALGTMRVTRVVSAVAAGRIINGKTATSQVSGSAVWGISQALHEETHCDHHLGRFMNRDFAGYHVAVNADIHEIDVIFVEEDDRIVSRLGAKGVGEIGIVAVSAAVSTAFYHATGRRLRTTPMTPDKVMASDAEIGSGASSASEPLRTV